MSSLQLILTDLSALKLDEFILDYFCKDYRDFFRNIMAIFSSLKTAIFFLTEMYKGNK